MNEATVDLMYGSQSFRYTSSKVNVFALATTEHPFNKQRLFPSEVLEPAPNARRGRNGRVLPNVTPASKNGSDLHGRWFNLSLQSQDGIVFLLQTNSTYHARPYLGAGMLVLLRHDADLIRIHANLTSDADAMFEQITVFVGRGDVIDPKEAKQLGVVLKPQYVSNYFQKSEQREAFDITVVQHGTPRPKLVTVQVAGGQHKRIRMPNQPGRRLRIRKS